MIETFEVEIRFPFDTVMPWYWFADVERVESEPGTAHSQAVNDGVVVVAVRAMESATDMLPVLNEPVIREIKRQVMAQIEARRAKAAREGST